MANELDILSMWRGTFQFTIIAFALVYMLRAFHQYSRDRYRAFARRQSLSHTCARCIAC